MYKPIIEVKNLSKKYTLGERQPYYSFRDTISGILHTPFRREKLEKDEFWALKDINFEIKQGESVGIIGRNGAGKSTLLKILSQITPPTTGKITMRGRVASLLEVGTGFHQELTGRENIYLNGAILGMKRWEINNKFKEIVEFSEIEKFLDTPVKHYSSGMYMRLAFAVAAHLESEILIVDEVLAVGDAQFQKKCLGKMDEVSKKQGRTVLFVSHNMGAVEQLCHRSILLEDGSVKKQGLSKDVVSYYISSDSNVSKNDYIDKNNKNKFFKKIIINNGSDVVCGGKVVFEIHFDTKMINRKLINSRVALSFRDVQGNYLFNCSTEQAFRDELNLDHSGVIVCKIDKLPLSEGSYSVDLFCEVNKEILDWNRNAFSLIVRHGIFHLGLRQTPLGHEGIGVLVSQSWNIINDKNVNGEN